MQHVSQKTDFELIDLANNGDDVAFTALLERYKPIVATTAINMLGDIEDAKEIGQQVFIRLYQSLYQFRRESSLKTYITRMTINLCLNFLKRRKNFQSRSFDLSTATHVRSNIYEPSDFESKEIINKALQKLDEKHRSVIVLRMIQGYSTLEASDILALPKGTILSRLKRGMDRLKTILEQEYNYEYK